MKLYRSPDGDWMKITRKEHKELEYYLSIVRDTTRLAGEHRIAMAKYDWLWRRITRRNSK